MRKVLVALTLLISSAAFAQSAQQNGAAAVVAPGDNLIVQGVPEVPSAIAEQANRYTEFRMANVYGWHPTRREIIIGTRFAETNQLHRVAMPGGARTQLTFFPDRISNAAYQPHKGDYIVFTKDVGGGEWFQIYRYDLANGDVTLLTDGKSRNLGVEFSNKGDRIAYSSTRRNRADLDFYVMDPLNKATDKLLVENQGGGWSVVDWSPDDSTLLAVEEISVNESYIWLVDVASGKKTLLTPKGADKIAYAPVGFSADGKGVYVTTDKDNEFQRLTYIDLATKQHRYLTNYKWDIEAAYLSWNRRMVAFATNENGLNVLHVLDLASGKERTVPKLPTGTFGAIEWHENNREIAVSVNSAKSPLDVFSVDLTTNKVDRWTASETGGLNPANFVDAQLVRWKSFDGREITGWLSMPPASKFPGKRPVMVSIHGGPEGQARPDFMGRFNYFVNEMGIAVLEPNVRGSTGYGKTFVALDNGVKREDSYRDIETLLRWIKQQPTLDGDKIMVMGGSYGGHMTLAVATRYNDMIACSVDVVGMSNLVTFLQNTEAYRRDLRRVEYGDERDPKMREFLESIAPMNHVDKIAKPIFVIQGANDPRVPKSEADQMVAALQKQGTPVWYLTAKDEGHGFAKKKNADFQFYSTILFVQQFLTGEKSQAAAPKP